MPVILQKKTHVNKTDINGGTLHPVPEHLLRTVHILEDGGIPWGEEPLFIHGIPKGIPGLFILNMKAD